MLTFNEGKVCDAVLRRLEERELQSRSDVRRPKQEQHAAPLEFAFKLGGQLLALEHTGIEPFPGHMVMDRRAPHLYAPITDALNNALGTSSLYELHIPINAFQNRKKLDIENIRNALIEWVKKTAPTLAKPEYYRGTSVSPTSVSEVPFQVSLTRFEPPIIPGHYFRLKHVVKDVEKKRTERMQKAVNDKLPKLARWKTSDGAKTVFVLEQNDIQLTAPDIVADAYVPLVKDRTDKPDETYLVGSCMSPSSYVWPILIGDKIYDDFVQNGKIEHWVFDPTNLKSLTER